VTDGSESRSDSTVRCHLDSSLSTICRTFNLCAAAHFVGRKHVRCRGVVIGILGKMANTETSEEDVAQFYSIILYTGFSSRINPTQYSCRSSSTLRRRTRHVPPWSSSTRFYVLTLANIVQPQTAISIEDIAPLSSPVHSIVRNQDRRQPVADLVTCAAESVEDGIACGAGERTLSVRGQGVGGDALLGLRACSSPSSVTGALALQCVTCECVRTQITPPS
jgi:hypothetical protein